MRELLVKFKMHPTPCVDAILHVFLSKYPRNSVEPFASECVTDVLKSFEMTMGHGDEAK